MSTAGGTNRPSGDLDRAPPDEPWLLTDDDDDAADQDGVETDTDHTPYASMRHTSSESSFSDLLSAHLFPPADPMLIQSAATASPYPPKMYTSVVRWSAAFPPSARSADRGRRASHSLTRRPRSSTSRTRCRRRR